MTDPLTETTLHTLPVDPPGSGQRMLLFFHRHLRAARAAGLPLPDLDILMFRPPSPDGQKHDGSPDHGEWLRVPANKYLKRRAEEWREGERVEDLPLEYQERAAAFEEWFVNLGVAADRGIGSDLGVAADRGIGSDLGAGADRGIGSDLGADFEGGAS